MRVHTEDFKTAIAIAGRQIKSKLLYTNNAKSQVIIDDDKLFEVKHITNGNILQSVMRGLEIETSEDIPLKTIVTYQLGLLVNNEYEYITFGNFVVTESEIMEESGHYKLICHDKLIYSMVDYSKLDITYPVTVKNYLQAICNKIGILFNDSEFANQDKTIAKELYLGFGYTFRDVLDEISQVAGGTICINDDDKLEIRYINDTQDVIDEDYLKNINVTFKEKYGPINTLILTRNADKISLSKPENLSDNQKVAIEIKDNQIMNWNDREEYMQSILAKIYGIEYYVNDFDSQGICYYDLCDKYTVKIDDNVYPCLLLNDEITINTGINETIFTEKPDDVVNDYKKSNKQDIKNTKVSLIVDQQEASITALATSNSELSQKTAQLRIDVDKIQSEIGEIADVTITAEGNGTITMQNINESEPIKIIVKPVGKDFSCLYPSSHLYPGANTFTKTRKIVFKNTTDNTTREYTIPRDLFYLSTTTYDEFVLDYENQECYVIHRVGKNADGTNYALQTENTEYFDYPTINLTDGDYTITLSEPTSYIFARLMTKNLYTSQFTTKVEANNKIEQSANQILSTVSQSYATKGELNSSVSSINQTTNSIELQVQQKVGNNEIISKINQSAETITIDARKINLNGYLTISNANATYATNDNLKNNYSSNTQLATKGSTIINGDNITTGTISADRIDTSKINAVTGTIGGWNISTTQLQKTIGNYTFEIRTDRSSNEPSLLVYDTSNSRYNWYVRPDGYMYARNCEVDGVLHAGNGSTIGGLTMSNGILSSSRLGLDAVDGIVRVFNSSGGSMILSNAVRLSATAGVGIYANSNGNISAPSINLDLKACAGATAYLACMETTSGTGEKSAVACENGILKFRSSGYCTYNGTSVFGSSSRASKKNIKDLTQEQKNEVYELLKSIPTKQYDYKKEYGKPFNYGFIIEDIEDTKLKDLLHITQAENNKDIKMYSTEDLVRLELIVIQELMKKVEELKCQ